MADPNFPSAPQTFTFAGRKLTGFLESFSGRNQRRAAVHEFLKRPGARVEDMERTPRRFEVRLIFLGDDCAKQYADFVDFLDKNPFGLLVHPTTGKFNAFCEGPNEEVSFANTINSISVRCAWVESNVDAPRAPQDTPSPPAAAQQVTAQQSAFKSAVAKYMGEIAQAKSKLASVAAQVQKATALVDIVLEPISLMREAISTAVGATSAVVGAIVSIQTQAELLSQDVTNFVLSTSDIFDGEDQAAGSSDGVDALLGQVVASGAASEEASLAASADVSPAGAADAVGATEELVASCYVLREALRQARPPSKPFIVAADTDIVSLMVALFPDADPLAQAQVVMSMNRIPNPALIRKGTKLRVPSR